jgi:cytochrome c
MQQNLARRKQPAILISIMALVYATILSACIHGPEPLSLVVPNGDIPQGQVTIQRYGCGLCHVIPGIDGANGVVGPPLTDWRHR